jgi:uncharacterized protein (DUF1330 family)
MRSVGEKTMKTRYAVALGIVAGFGLGSFAVHGLRAQTKPDPLIKPAYIIAEANVKDEEHYIREFFPAHIKAIEEAHGIYVVADGKPTLLQGSSLVNRTPIRSLAKHDETYMPKEVAAALKKTGHWRGPVTCS